MEEEKIKYGKEKKTFYDKEYCSEAAETYITENKPCLSIKEFRECMPRYLSTGEVKSILDKASKIVKSKLND